MSPKPTNDVPPEILSQDEDEDVVSLESSSDVEFDLEAHPGSVKRGTEIIQHFWRTLPNAPL